jgi:hypothetical protein
MLRQMLEVCLGLRPTGCASPAADCSVQVIRYDGGIKKIKGKGYWIRAKRRLTAAIDKYVLIAVSCYPSA